MRKNHLLIFVPLCAVLSAAGSASSPPANANAPAWINDLPPDDVLWGIGSAKQSTEDFSMTMAETRGIQSISRQLLTVAQGMITDYARDAGAAGSQASIQFQEGVAVQLTNAKLNGATPIKRWKAPDGTWWYLVQFGKSSAAQAAGTIIDNEAARYAEFKALEATKEMDARLEKFNEKPVAVTE